MERAERMERRKEGGRRKGGLASLLLDGKRSRLSKEQQKHCVSISPGRWLEAFYWLLADKETFFF